MKQKKYYVAILLLSAITSLTQSVVHADDIVASVEPSPLQATPYPTLTPIGATTTPYSILTPMNFSCPAGVPAGYGTVTPSTDWLYACGQCLPTGTPVAFSTSTVGPTHTPAFTTSTPSCEGEDCPTATITPTSTVTATPTSTPTATPIFGSLSCAPEGSSGVLTCTNIDDVTVLLEVIGNPSENPNIVYPITSTSSGYLYFQTDWVSELTYTPLGGWSGLDWVRFGVRDFLSNEETQNYILYGSDYYDCSGTCGKYISGVYEHFESITAGTFDVGIMKGSNPAIAHFYTPQNSSVLVSLFPFGATPTPTPIVTGTPVSDYCASLSSSTVPNIFQFGGGNVVYQVCQTTPEIGLSAFLGGAIAFFLPDLAEEIAEIFPIDSVVPPITWCVRSRDYSLYLFGIRMPIELLVGLSIFLGGVRFFVPSAFSGASILGSARYSSGSDNDSSSSKSG